MKKYSLIVLASLLSLGFFAFEACKGDDCTERTWYQDADGDGYGNPNMSKAACDKPEGYVADKQDFNDAAASAYPGAKEICNDGIDNDGDSFADCKDFDCLKSTVIECDCKDGMDNDSDGLIDCADNDCKGSPDC